MSIKASINRVVFQSMGGPCEIVSVGGQEQTAEVAARVIKEVNRIETKFSRYQSGSILSQINANAGRHPIQCDAETWGLLEFAGSLYSSSGGLFDATSGVLRRAWNFKNPVLPQQEQLANVLQLVGWEKVKLDNQCIMLDQMGMELDFGGFAKEYAVDRAAAIMETMGLPGGYINLSGDMRFVGPKLDGAPWSIGIQNSRNPNELMATIAIEYGALATSGDYERYFELDGERYCHLIHPLNGMPVGYWRSVSVLAPLCILAGSATTVTMLMQDQGLNFLNDSSFSYLAEDKTGKVHQRDIHIAITTS